MMPHLSEILEFAMLFAFGFSWPFAIMRTYRAKRVDGKSPAFMIIVLFGYLCELPRISSKARSFGSASSIFSICPSSRPT